MKMLITAKSNETFKIVYFKLNEGKMYLIFSWNCFLQSSLWRICKQI